ncbi:hypothetical protein KIPB_000787 [Kipferlia bialata]|uniref:Uncharacterized protein n=1 Tax=Kipferlia bialata TaxID=797122 RepID=A0A9K3GDP8_9EUKA|nr:hypothetical protein KIPB_000787 [Kipferlia bialata]|eukprot:g787.t1
MRKTGAHVRVFVKVRPPAPGEHCVTDGGAPVVSVGLPEDDGINRSLHITESEYDARHFTFDSVFGSGGRGKRGRGTDRDTGAEGVYHMAAEPLVEDVCEGRSAVLVGMGGALGIGNNAQCSKRDSGKGGSSIASLAIRQLYEHGEILTLGAVEISRNKVHDIRTGRPLTVRHSRERGFYVEGLKYEEAVPTVGKVGRI